MTIPTITDDILDEIERDSMAEISEGYDRTFISPQQAIAMIDRIRQLEKDAALLDGLDSLCEGYGTHEHEGNEWKVYGPFSNVRDAIDSAMQATQ